MFTVKCAIIANTKCIDQENILREKCLVVYFGDSQFRRN